MDSDWPTVLDVEVLSPNAVTTTSVSADRAIDFGLISKSIYKFFKRARPIFSVPWVPHYGEIFSFLMNPKSIKGKILCVPKALPIHHFSKIWKTLSEDAKGSYAKNSENRAKNVLQKQKRHTGVAILGRPDYSLDTDIKFQGDLKIQCIRVGEQLAFASLSSEFLVLDVVGVARDQQSRYTGRSQYAKIKERRLITI